MKNVVVKKRFNDEDIIRNAKNAARCSKTKKNASRAQNHMAEEVINT